MIIQELYLNWQNQQLYRSNNVACKPILISAFFVQIHVKTHPGEINVHLM